MRLRRQDTPETLERLRMGRLLRGIKINSKKKQVTDRITDDDNYQIQSRQRTSRLEKGSAKNLWTLGKTTSKLKAS
jgi:hypothetical protein